MANIDSLTYDDRGLTVEPTATTGYAGRGPGEYRRVLGASTLTGDRVVNHAGEDLGKLHELMIDVQSGRVTYAVLSFGGFLGMGDKLFAIPWNRLTVDEANQQILLDVDKAKLESAPGFDKDNWPDMADSSWESNMSSYYGTQPYGSRYEERDTVNAGMDTSRRNGY